MTTQEKCIIDTILNEAGLEPLYAEADAQESKTKPVTAIRTIR